MKFKPRVRAIIPARGGSKGIPRKNLKLVDRKPLVAHSIEHALQASRVSRVYVSSDDAEIIAVARQYGAETVLRPTEISGDTASSEQALRHALDHIKAHEGQDPDIVVFLQATSAIRNPSDIDAALDLFLESDADSLFSATPAHGFVWRLSPHGPVSVTYDHRERQRRQDIEEHVVENGSFYIFKPWVLRTCDNRLGGKIAVYKMGFLEALQIDEPQDLDLIRWCMHAMRTQGRS